MHLSVAAISCSLEIIHLNGKCAKYLLCESRNFIFELFLLLATSATEYSNSVENNSKLNIQSYISLCV